MKRKLKQGSTSVIVPIRIDDTSSTTGAGLTGLTHASASLVARYKRSDQSGWTTINLVAGTLGTWVTEGFVEAGRGVYELSLPNAALSAGTWAIVQLYGATNMADVNLEIELDQINYQDAAAAGLSRLDTAVSSRSSHAAADVWAVGSRTLTGYGTLVSDIAAAVWAAGTRTLTAIADSAGVTTLLDRLSADRATKLDNLDAAVSSRLATAGYTAPPTVTQIRQEMDANSTDLDAIQANQTTINTNVLSRLATASYTAPDNATISATSTALTTLAAKFDGITSMAWWLRLLGRKDTANATAKSEYNASGGTYDEATDSQQGAVDSGGSGLTAAAVWGHPSRTLTQSAAQVVSAVSGEAITVLRGDHLEISLTDIGSLVGRAKLWFTVKSDPNRDSDNHAVLQITEGGGLVRLGGAAYSTTTDGEIDVTDAAGGDLTITIKAAASRQLPIRTGMSYDVQILVDGEPITRISGTFNVTADVTQAVS